MTDSVLTTDLAARLLAGVAIPASAAMRLILELRSAREDVERVDLLERMVAPESWGGLVIQWRANADGTFIGSRCSVSRTLDGTDFGRGGGSVREALDAVRVDLEGEEPQT